MEDLDEQEIKIQAAKRRQRRRRRRKFLQKMEDLEKQKGEEVAKIQPSVDDDPSLAPSEKQKGEKEASVLEVEEQKGEEEDESYCPDPIYPQPSEIDDDPSLFVMFINLKNSVLGYHIKPFNPLPTIITETEIPRIYPFAQFPENARGSGFASVGSKLYCFGGAEVGGAHDFCGFNGSNHIWVYDTKTPLKSWYKHSSSMIVNRSYPVAITVGTKIFIFGSNMENTPVPDPWFEVFNTETGRSSFPTKGVSSMPKILSRNHCVNGHLVSGNTIYLESKRNLYSYHIKRKEWNKLPMKENSSFIRICDGATVVDGVVYAYFHGLVVAYDLESKKHCVLEDLLLQIRTYHMVFKRIDGSLHHVGGGRMCVFFTANHEDPECQSNCLMYLICVGFRARKVKPTNDAKLNIRTTIISVQSYIFEGFIFCQSVGSFSMSKPPSESSSSYLKAKDSTTSDKK